MGKSKDLFDDSTMSFGEHLEALRTHLWKALIGLVLGVILALIYGEPIMAIIRAPIDSALKRYGQDVSSSDDVPEDFSVWEYAKSQFGYGKEEAEAEAAIETAEQRPDAVVLTLSATDLLRALHEADPEAFPAPAEDAEEKLVTLPVAAPQFREFRETAAMVTRPVTLTVQEAFMTYVKVAVIAGLVLSSPWVFYQLWLFVAAGLYPHERHYVYLYLPMSLGLFLGGAVFCFTMVFPFVLKFLLSFNTLLGITPQIRISEWISFAVTMPLMFGLSFQLPLVMLFLERISVFDASDYREKRRMSILVIAILSMVLTPADPASMLLMMIPLLALYELGILLCNYSPSKSPYEGAESGSF